MWELWLCRSGRVSARSHSTSDFPQNTEIISKFRANQFNLRFSPKIPNYPKIQLGSETNWERKWGQSKKTPKIPEISQIYRFATLLVESRNLRIPQNSLNTQSSSAVQSQQIFNNQNKPNNHPKLKLMWFKIEILKSIVQNICVWVSFPNSVDYERLPLFFVVVGRMKHKCLLITLGRGSNLTPMSIEYQI